MAAAANRWAPVHRVGLFTAVACLLAALVLFAIEVLTGDWGWAAYFAAAAALNLGLARWNAKQLRPVTS